jgi:hypothetical protein
LKEEMGGFEKRVGMRESDEGDGREVEGFGWEVVRKSIVVCGGVSETERIVVICF